MDPASHLLKVVDVVEETAEAHSVSFEVPEGLEEEFRYRPGQFLTLAVPSDRTGVAARCYSLSSSPHDGGPLTVTVKRTADGYASNWICDHVRPGSTVRVLPPSGIFTPASLDADLLLLAGGSGVTPIMSITRTVLAQGSGRVVLLYANRDEQSVIFARELADLAAAHPDRLQVIHWLESLQGLPSPEQLTAFVAGYPEHDLFCCGPAPFMKMAITAAKQLGFPRERRHQEKFVSLGGNPFGDVFGFEQAEREVEDADSGAGDGTEPESTVQGPVTVEVELDGETHRFDDWAPEQRLLDFLEGKGVQAPSSCREGECSACAVRLLEGEVTLVRNDVLDAEDLAEGIRLGCQALPATEVVRVTYS